MVVHLIPCLVASVVGINLSQFVAEKVGMAGSAPAWLSFYGEYIFAIFFGLIHNGCENIRRSIL